MMAPSVWPGVDPSCPECKAAEPNRLELDGKVIGFTCRECGHGYGKPQPEYHTIRWEYRLVKISPKELPGKTQ